MCVGVPFQCGYGGVVSLCSLKHLPMKMEPIVSSETLAIRTQTPGNYPKRNNLHLEHGESLRTRSFWLNLCNQNVGDKGVLPSLIT